MTAVGFALFCVVMFIAFMEKHGGLKISQSGHAAFGLLLVAAYMLMVYGLTAFFWANLP